MKKIECISWEWKIPGLQKVLRIMKLTVFLLLLSVISVFAGKSYSQTQVLNLDMKNSTVKEVLRNIEKQSEFVFMYSEKLIDVNREVSVTVKNKKIYEVLDELFAGTNVEYKVKDRFVLLTTPEVTGSYLMAQQQKSVSGKVTDSGSLPLPGVTVVVKGTTQGTVTNADGDYTLANISEDATLVFSFVGMRTQEINIGNRTTINLEMEEETIGIEEVVTIGYGTQKKVNLTGSVSSVSSEEINKRPVNNVAVMLQGKIPGLQVIQNSGAPGAEGANLLIRGLTSYGSSSAPLVLVDGIEGSLDKLDPEMVESISVLKDAASAAIYGSRASNGVILVTTKEGGGEMNMEAHINYGIHDRTRSPELINNSAEFMTLLNEARVNSRGPGNELYTEEEINLYRNNVGNPQYPNTRWEDYTLRTGDAKKYFLSLNGGKSATTYYAGVSYLDQKGVEVGSDFKKYNVLLNLKSQLNKVVTFNTKLNFSYYNRHETNVSISSYASKPLRGPYMPGDDTKYSAQSYAKEYNNWNPMISIENGTPYSPKSGYEGILNGGLDFNLMEGLIWSTTGSVKLNFDNNKSFDPRVLMYDWHTGELTGYSTATTAVSIKKSENKLYTVYSTINYDRLFAEKHHVIGLLGYSQENLISSYMYAYRKNTPNNIITELNAAGTEGQQNEGTTSEWAIRSLFGRLNYVFDSKYLFEASFRYDGSSRFSEGNKWGMFPSFSAGWIVSNEPFMENVSFISKLKIRPSWGSLGNQQIGNYPYQETYNLGLNYPFGTSVQPGAYVSSLNNNSITWEKTTITNIGVDFGFFNNKLYGNFDWFHKLTSDILRGAQVPGFIGLSAPVVNGGKLKNTGFEILIGHENSREDFRHNLNFILSHSKNILVDYGERQILEETIREEGLPWDSWYLLKWKGIFQSQEEIDNAPLHQYNPKPGDLRYEDISGPNDVPDGKIDHYDRTVIEGKYPKFEYGSNLSFEWKNFDLSVFLQGSYGTKIPVFLWGYEPFFQEGRPPTIWRDRWTPENPSTTLPRLYMPGEHPAINPGSATTTSSYFLQDASYLRLKNLQFGYSIPFNISNKIGAKDIRLYFSGDNLFVITNYYKGGDPERISGGRFAKYEQIRILSIGAKINF